jgi:hypothetical protein
MCNREDGQHDEDTADCACDTMAFENESRTQHTNKPSEWKAAMCRWIVCQLSIDCHFALQAARRVLRAAKITNSKMSFAGSMRISGVNRAYNNQVTFSLQRHDNPRSRPG